MIKKETYQSGETHYRAECHGCDSKGIYSYINVGSLVEDMSKRGGAPMGAWTFSMDNRVMGQNPIPYCPTCAKKLLLPLITDKV